MKMRAFFLVLAVLIFAFPVQASGNAEVDARTFVVGSITAQINYNSISKEFSDIEQNLKSGAIDARTISKYVSYLGSIGSELQESRKQLEADLKSTTKRIESLGETPKEGTEELPMIAEKRKEYNEELIYQKGKIAEADLLINRTEELTNLIATVRKQALIGNLLFYQEPIIYPRVLLRATGEFMSFGFGIMKSPLVWYSDLNAEQKATVWSNILPVMLLVVAALAVGIFLRLLIIRRLGYKKNAEGVTYFSRIVAAFFVACAYGIIPAVLLGSFLFWIKSTEILASKFFGVALSSVLYYSLYIFLSNAATRVVFAPYNPKWRLVNMESEKAKRLTKAFYFSFTMIGVCAMLRHIAEQSNSSLELLYYLSVISTSVKVFCIVWIIKRFFWEDTMAQSEEAFDVDDTDNAARKALRIIFISGASAFLVVGISLFGYPRLSEFIVNRFMITVLLVCVIFMLRKAVFELLKKVLLLNFWVKKLRVQRRLLDKVDFWLGAFINPIFAIIGILIILTLWGVSTDILLQSLKKLFLGFKIGGVEISLILIILGVAVFFGSLAAVRVLRSRFLENILQHLDIDDGIKHSLASGFGFVGFVLSVVLSITVMGGDLSNLALVAGALSVGIGFGLQNIVNNFMSGIILLFERPVKVGDWVKINGEEGKIKQINIRSTEIETFAKSSVIIPNATLLSTSVTNMTHDNNWMRFTVAVGVAYGSDTEKVKKILLECAAANKKVLKKPEPYVLFQNFGASSLDFELRGYSSNIWDGWIIPSELRFAINRRFIEEGIEIPFSQLVVHHGSEVGAQTKDQFYALKHEEEQDENK
ncbi:MAG: mechanosensitive ion channel family protein [Alphaproteobacteria bacterium]|nr:mechanosensitive ion channel family protein [Alphaproteobacteria bacterium]